LQKINNRFGNAFTVSLYTPKLTMMARQQVSFRRREICIFQFPLCLFAASASSCSPVGLATSKVTTSRCVRAFSIFSGTTTPVAVAAAAAAVVGTADRSDVAFKQLQGSALVKSFKQGIGRLTASAYSITGKDSLPNASKSVTTRLTQVSHKAPTRLVPIGKSSVDHAGAAICALSNYGAGMLQGDSSDLVIHVQQGAKLGVVTQGASRIYTPNRSSIIRASNNFHDNDDHQCRANLRANVEQDAILVLAPDPCALFASSSFTQIQRFNIHPQSSVALIDWFSSGRFMNQEQWAFDKLYTRTSLHWLEDNINYTDDQSTAVPFLQDATLMDFRVGRSREWDTHAIRGYNCFASLLLYGQETRGVVQQCQELSDELAANFTRIRDREQYLDKRSSQTLNGMDHHGIRDSSFGRTHARHLGLAGRVTMGVSRVELLDKPSDAYAVRLAARTNEDLYRVFHECLLPLSDQFGWQFYKDRIRAHQSEIPHHSNNIQNNPKPNRKQPNGHEMKGKEILTQQAQEEVPSQPTQSTTSPTTNIAAFWSILMLADSGLPTGSFAHSAGVETATQLQMIQSEQDVEDYVNAATRSAMQISIPFLISGHELVLPKMDVALSTTFAKKWEHLQRQCQAVMATNEPACVASLDQGKSLARIASHWLRSRSSSNVTTIDKYDEILDCLTSTSPHVAPTIGVIGGLLGLDRKQVCQLFAYCVARDMVSAAVRLSLVGPLASVPLLHRIQESAEDGIQAVTLLMGGDFSSNNNPLNGASASAPVMEALHPCHEILQVRLFRS
jgi:urease accessory protein